MASPKPQQSEARQTLAYLLKLAIFFWLLRSLVVAPFSIPSESMLPRLLIGDYLFVSKLSYGWSRWSFPWGFPPVSGHLAWSSPKRGDVVVFRGPPGEDHDVIKRVIGVAGDTIQVRRGQLILNGAPVPKRRIGDFVLPLSPNFDESHCAPQFQAVEAGTPVCRLPRYRETLPGGASYDVLDQGTFPDRDDTGLYRVPKGDVFVMGDNRDNSADSRFPAPADALPGQQPGMGYLPLDHVEGKAIVSFFSTDGSASWVKPWTWVSAARWRRIGEGF